MNVIINDKSCSAAVGQTLGKVALHNHSHVGYVCGGHGVCQACYVTVQAGRDLLSPLTDIEQAFLSPRQVAAGGRLACQATITGEGTISVLSRPEEIKRALLSNPISLASIATYMGKDTLQQIRPGIGNLVGRITRGEMGGGEALGDLAESVRGAAGLAMEQLPKMIPFGEQIAGIIGSLPKLPVELPISLPFARPKPTETLERVAITVGTKKA